MAFDLDGDEALLMATEFKLPELGENVEKGDVTRVLVAVGDVVKVDQSVVELETDKATIEVPTSVAGKVTAVRVKAGDKVKVGQVVLEIDSNGAGAPAAKTPAPAPAAAAPAAKPAPAPESTRPEVVDINTARAASSRAPEARPAAVPARVEAASSAPAPVQAKAGAAANAAAVPAAPSVRRFARELGLNITDVAGTGPGGRIGPEDVKEFVKSTLASGPAVGTAPRRAALPDFSKWGEVEVKPMSNIRRKTAEHLSLAWQAPHVTQNDRADITAVEEFRHAFGPRVEKAGGKLTVTAMVIKVCAAAIARYPQFATSVDLAAETMVFKKYIHIGVAVDTPNGLLVPVIRDVNRKTITEIAVELAALSQKARDKKLSLDEMSGGVFSITNLGGIGGTSFTPIINPPEVAILGLSRSSTEPVWNGSVFAPRLMLPLSLSYDHRAIDGADAARFLRFVAEGLEQPMSMVL
jgi:pyruvate dehydrogenase E2 component (dihydrolipoamide acetyltransferase)